eukprot:TRINITY_DN77831_c0_g1_i1.p1 TRINITY_DN77831_c0_g1~~TRINITY_DN77831_c0_g1_i1.p1  ORF type:complete len:173 (+),score=25.24 TRINITY_DN77831_c0_g1_i1:89-607(+)
MLSLNRFKAWGLRNAGKTDHKATRSVFAQAYRQMGQEDIFRKALNEKAWKVSFEGERAEDAGGPYNESINDFCEELQSSVLPLFIKCPNQRSGVGVNREKFVPSPSATKPLHLSLYEFLGKLMGLAMRTGTLLNLDLPSIIWKPLVDEEVTEEIGRAVQQECRDRSRMPSSA